MAFERVGVRLVVEGMGQFNRAMNDVQKAFKKSGDASRKANKDVKDFNQALTNTALAMVGVGAAGGAFFVSATKLAARVETLGVVVRRLGQNVGMTADEMGALEKGIKDQGITLQATRKSIALMVQAQIDLTKGTELARLAQDAAVIANVDSSEAFQRLVFVITSGNVRMARTLGLQVSFQESYKKMAASIGVATTELSQQQKVQARTNAVIAAGATIGGAYEEAMGTAGKKLLSLNRHIEDSTRIIGQAWLPEMELAVDAVTDLLKGFQDTDESVTNVTSRLAGSIVAIIGVTGAVLLLIKGVLALKGAMTGLALASGIALAPLVLLAATIAAVVVIGVQLIALNKQMSDSNEEVSKATGEMTDRLIKADSTYEEYAKEIDRVNKVIEDQSHPIRFLIPLREKMTEADFDAAVAQQRVADEAEEADKRLIALGQAYRDLHDPEKIAAREAANVAREEERVAAAAKEAAAQQEILADALGELKFAIDLGFADSAEDFRTDMDELELSLAELAEERIEAIVELEVEGLQDAEDAAEAIDRLNDQRGRATTRLGELEDQLKLAQFQQSEFNEDTKESTRIAKENQIARITNDIKEQRERVGELTGTIQDWTNGTLTAGEKQEAALASLESDFTERGEAIRDQIDQTKQAFSEQTASMIFDLLTQRAAMDGLTSEELALLSNIAGPEGLGLLDEANVQLIKSADEILTALTLPGDQVEQATGDVIRLFDGMVEAVNSDTDDIGAAIDAIPSEVSILFNLKETGEIPTVKQLLALEPDALARIEAILAVTTPGGREFFASILNRQHGGRVGRGGAIVGEAGPELFFPGSTGTVLPNNFVRSLASLFRSALPVASAAGGAGGGSVTNTTNMGGMTINTSAPHEPIQADFEMMRALSKRRR